MISKLSGTLILCAPIAMALVFADVVPTDVQLPGTQVGEASLEAVSRCDNCHGGYDLAVEPAHNWRGSMMAQAGRDPLFWATVAIAEQDFDGAGDLCIRCHSPEGWIQGRSTPTDGSDLVAADADGVSCDVCHQLTNPDDSEHLGVQNAPFVANDGGDPATGFYGSGMFVLFDQAPKLGPYASTVARHSVLQSQFHRSSDLCGTCHDVSNPVVGDLAPENGAMVPLLPGTFSGIPGAAVTEKAAFLNEPFRYGTTERTFSEHVASGLDTLRVSDYPTLPDDLRGGALALAYAGAIAADPSGDYVDGTPRTFTCQTCHLPPVEGKGCDKNNAPLRADLPLHDMTGGNTWVPDAIEYLDGLDQLVLGENMTTDEVDALRAGAQRAQQNLESAAGLTVQGDVLRVVNRTGHKLLTGYPEGRRMWLRVRWSNANGSLVREDGAYGVLDVEVDGQSLQVESLLDLSDPHLVIYEIHLGLSSPWAVDLLGLGYDPLLPLAFDRVSGATTLTLGELAADSPDALHETFHFVLNDVVVSDNRIPPYELAYDDALERSCLPVPPDQYGDPGPGGVYDYWDEVVLQPPPGAVTATIELLYQTTSWEYVQFLLLANDGSVAFLADEGEHLLDAWLATGMSPPVVMASAEWRAPPGDCNGNGVPDDEDIANGDSRDRNENGIPDECETPVRPVLEPLRPVTRDL